MALGLIPAAIVGVVMLSGVVALSISLPGITVAITPFAEEWPGLWASVIRATIGTAMLGAALVLVAVSFTALTLIVGEPFYERIWRSVERDLGQSGARRRLRLLALGARRPAAVRPRLGSPSPPPSSDSSPSPAACWPRSSRSRSRAGCSPTRSPRARSSVRGIDYPERRRLLRRRRARVLGFGVATQLCFMIPLGAVATMPAAVAGATHLAHSLLPTENVPS